MIAEAACLSNAPPKESSAKERPLICSVSDSSSVRFPLRDRLERSESVRPKPVEIGPACGKAGPVHDIYVPSAFWVVSDETTSLGTRRWRETAGRLTGRSWPSRYRELTVVGQDVHQLAKWIAHKESTNAPGLVGRAILDRDLRILDPRKRRLEIVDLNR